MSLRRPTHKPTPHITTNTPPARSSRSGNKADLFRVILGLYETGFFKDSTGRKSAKKDVFAAFGQMLHEDFDEFEKHLAAMKNLNNDSPANSAIFDKLKSAVETYMSPKH